MDFCRGFHEISGKFLERLSLRVCKRLLEKPLKTLLIARFKTLKRFLERFITILLALMNERFLKGYWQKITENLLEV